MWGALTALLSVVVGSGAAQLASRSVRTPEPKLHYELIPVLIHQGRPVQVVGPTGEPAAK
jgi:hypothetical protein